MFHQQLEGTTRLPVHMAGSCTSVSGEAISTGKLVAGAGCGRNKENLGQERVSRRRNGEERLDSRKMGGAEI